MIGNLIFFLVFLSICSAVPQTNRPTNKNDSKLAVYKDEDDGKSSLVFVFDTTGSMYNDLRQLREGAEMILNTALEESGVIADFVFVPFHDPAVGPATVTKEKEVFKAALNIVRVYGGGDCPEKSLGGIQLALNVSRPRSYVYVFTDATASDHTLVGQVLDAVQRKQSQVVFVLTGHCNDLHRPHYQVYQQIAAASSGQVFNLNKTSVHKVLEFVRSSLRGRTVNLGSAVNAAGYNFTQGIPIDSTLAEVTVSVSGSRPSIKVVKPSGEELTGPPQLVTTLDLSEIMIVKVLDPEPGNWSITTGSAEPHSVKVVGLSNLTFEHGFSVERPASMAETSYRPLQGAYNHMMISLTEIDRPVQVSYAEILALDGKTLFEIPLREVHSVKKIYLADAFVPPDEFFYIAVNGRDEYNQELRRIGATAVQAKPPDVPYLTVPKKVEARAHERIVLTCDIESLVPLTAVWTKDSVKIQQQVSSLQSTSIEYVIGDMSEEHVGTYGCVAHNVAGTGKAVTEVILLVDPPQVSIAPENKTIQLGECVTVTCTATSDALLLNYRLAFNGTLNHYVTDINLEPNIEGLYVFNKTIQNVSEKDDGLYTCFAANRGGQTTHSTQITIQTDPVAQILGPHTLTKHIYTHIQLVCRVENAYRLLWTYNGNIVKDVIVNGSYNDMFDVENVTGDGVWSCTAVRGAYKASDSVEISVLIKPTVTIEGPENITIVNGTSVDIVCNIVAKPVPRILWHRETETFLNNTVTLLKANTYKSVLTLNSSKEDVVGTYFCFGENSEGIQQDSVTVSVRRMMTVLEGLTDQIVQLYSQASLRCPVDSYPAPKIKWYHNQTEIILNDNMYLSENNNSLYILKLDFDDLGAYSCVADNGFEKLEVGASLMVVGLESPVLSKEPVRRITQKGKSTILTCRVIKGSPHPSITWQYKSNYSDQFAALPRGVIANRDDTELIISRVEQQHWGLYRCVAENVLGRDVYDVLLIVQFPPEIKQDSNLNMNHKLEVEAGHEVTFSCKATGVPPPTVTWSKDNHAITYSKNIYLTDSSDLVIAGASQHDSGLFTCNATSALGSLQKNYTLLVFVRPSLNPPGIGPNLEVLEGELVELPCAAQGVPAPGVQWLQNGVTITEGRKHVDEFGLRFVANLTDFGEYTCVAKNDYGNASVSFSVYIWVLPYIEAPLETSNNVMLGNNISLECNAVGFPIPIIVWEFQNKMLTHNTTNISFNEYGNVFITNASTTCEGYYVCIAENVAGVAKKTIYLSVNEPPRIIKDEYTGLYIATTQDAELVISCRATGKPRPYVLWAKDGRFLDKDSRYDVDVDGTLTIKEMSVELSGQYTCVAKNSVGLTNKTVAVEIYALPTRMQADESHTSTTVLEGTNATIECPIRAGHNDIVKWYKDAKLISTGDLFLSNVTRQNVSTYACVVTNAIGSAYSKVQVVVEWGPRFTGKGGHVEVVRGDDWYFDCGVDAKPEAKIKWLFNSKPLLGEDKTRLKLLNIQSRHAGVYKCVAGNPHGTIARQFTLDVLVPPFISEFDVLDVQLKEGMDASLECYAKGSPTPTIMWSYNNTNWHVIKNSLTTYNITPQSEGMYRCDAVNEAGAVYLVYRVSVSSPATVTDITMFTNGSGGENVLKTVELTVGSHIRLSCKATGKPTPTIQWIKNGDRISENDEDIQYVDLVLHEVESQHGGLYSCVASNEGGVDEKVVKVDVLEPPTIFQDEFQTGAGGSDNVTRLEVISGQAFFLHCHPHGNPPPEVYWFKDDLPLRLFDDTMVSKHYGEVIVSHSARLEQSGRYTCVARNKLGQTSVTYLVEVLVPPPTPKESVIHVTTRLGRPLYLTCPVEGTPLPTVAWVKHPYTEIGGQTPRVTLVDDHYALIINTTEVQDSGKYSCIMTNKVGTTEVVFDVTIAQRPTVAGDAGDGMVENRVVLLRRSVVLKCQVDGNPPPKISWLKDTQHLSDSAPNIQRVLGSSLLAVWSADTRDAGQYICVAENTAGSAHRRYNVVVQVPGKWTNWSAWSFCNVTCGLGHQQRSRACHYLDDYNNTYDKSTKSDRILLDESSCKGSTNDRRKCHMPPCEDDETQSRWSVWSRWSPCSVTCGPGSQARTRRCRSKTPAPCVGDNVQIRKCPGMPKCSSQSSQQPAQNEVFSSKENTTETTAYIPEAIFEMQPEIVNSQNTEFEEVYIKPEAKYSTVYYDVNVTMNLDRSYRGACDPGYRHDNDTGSCEDIDECLIESNLCHSTQVCVNTAGAYRCHCPAGFFALGIGQRCLDINECEQDIAGCSYACVNTAGGYVCACPRHLRLHTDKHHCVPPSMYQKPYTLEELQSEEYLSAAIELPARYSKNTK